MEEAANLRRARSELEARCNSFHEKLEQVPSYRDAQTASFRNSNTWQSRIFLSQLKGEKSEEISVLKFSWEEAEAERLRLASDCKNLDHRLEVETEQLQQNCARSEGKVSDLTREMAALQTHYDDQCRANDELKTQLLEGKSGLEESDRHNQNK